MPYNKDMINTTNMILGGHSMENEKKTVNDLRAETGLSQCDYAIYFGIPVRTIQDWEQGRRKPPVYLIDMMERILKNEYHKKTEE